MSLKLTVEVFEILILYFGPGTRRGGERFCPLIIKTADAPRAALLELNSAQRRVQIVGIASLQGHCVFKNVYR